MFKKLLSLQLRPSFVKKNGFLFSVMSYGRSDRTVFYQDEFARCKTHCLSSVDKVVESTDIHGGLPGEQPEVIFVWSANQRIPVSGINCEDDIGAVKRTEEAHFQVTDLVATYKCGTTLSRFPITFLS